MKKFWVRGWTMLIAATAFCGNAAISAEPAASSLNWQRIELQQKLKEDLTKVLSGVVGPDLFVVNVDVKFRKPAPKAVKPVSKAPASTDAKDGTNELLLSKLGLDAPADFGSAVDAVDSEVAENDIFNVLEKIRISCLLDNSIPDERQEVIKKVIASGLLQYDQKMIDVTLDKVQLVTLKKEEVTREPASEKSIGEKFQPFSVPVSIFLSFLVVMGMMFMLFRASKPVAMPASAAATSTTPEPPKEATPVEAAPAVQAAPAGNAYYGSTADHAEASGTSPDEVQLTIEKFKGFLKTSAPKCRLVLQEWINNESEVAQSALQTLSMYLSLEEFAELTVHFTPSEKKMFKRIMASSGESSSTSETMSFMRGQLLAAFLSDDGEMTDQHKAFLATLKASELAELAKQDDGLVAGVVNLIPSDLVAQTLNLVEPEMVGRLLQQSASFNSAEFLTKFADLEAKVNAIRESSKVVLAPVLDGVETLLEQMAPEKEGYLFTALAASNAFVMMEDLSRRYFPSDLVLKLEPAKLNTVILRMPIAKRAELICSLGETEKAAMMAAIGEKGKMRELIDSELEGLQADAGRKKTIEANKSAIWKSFVELVRESVQSNPVVQENAETVLRAWIDEKKATGGASKAA